MNHVRKVRQCPRCPYTSTQDNFARHIKAVHGEAPPERRRSLASVMCEQCDPPRPISKANMSRHVKLKHTPGQENHRRRPEGFVHPAGSEDFDPSLQKPCAPLLQHESQNADTSGAMLMLSQATDRHQRPELVKLILRLLFAEVVHPHTRRLVAAQEPKYAYGELNFAFVSYLLAKFKISRDSTVVDIGSGVGNIVLQAVLEYGCFAHGCEIVQDRSTVAEAFIEQGLVWASKFAGTFGATAAEDLAKRVTLRHGDAFTDAQTQEKLRVANLVICNNLLFPPELLHQLVELVLGVVKSGAVFVSTQSIIRGKGSERRQILEDIDEEKCRSPDDSVSWAHNGIDYWIYTKKGKEPVPPPIENPPEQNGVPGVNGGPLVPPVDNSPQQNGVTGLNGGPVVPPVDSSRQQNGAPGLNGGPVVPPVENSGNRNEMPGAPKLACGCCGKDWTCCNN